MSDKETSPGEAIGAIIVALLGGIALAACP